MALFVRSFFGIILGLALFGHSARAQEARQPTLETSTANRLDVDFTTVPGRFMGRLEYPINPKTCKPKSGKGLCGGICTATLVGPSLIATAAHCVPVEEHTADGPQSWSAQHARFRLHYRAGSYTAESPIVGVVQENFGPKLPSFTGRDWTLLKLKYPLGRKFGWIELSPLIAPPGVEVAAAGYSSDWSHHGLPGSELPSIDPKCGTVRLSNPKPQLIPYEDTPLNPAQYAEYYLAYLVARAKWHPFESSYFTTCQLNHGGSGGPLVTTIGTKQTDGSVRYKTFLIGINDIILKTNRGILSQQADTSRYYLQWLGLLTQDLYNEIQAHAKASEDPEKQAILKQATEAHGKLVAGMASLALNFGGPLNVAVGVAAQVQLLDQTAQTMGKLHATLLEPKPMYYLGVTFKDELAPLTVAAVEPGSPAEELGFEPGDKIVGVDGFGYPNEYEFHALLNRSKGRSKFVAEVEDQRTEFAVALPALRQ